MDFFQSQDVARRNTRLLLFLFGLAVVSLIILTNLLVIVLVNMQDTYSAVTMQVRYDWQTFTWVSIGVVTLITLASLFRLKTLSQGGHVVAEMMDGELLVDPGGDLNKRKLMNVVEEMAIASGTPVPPIYVIEDPAINAFAAGYSPGDAVIGVTRGAMEGLSRDELQGVIAHEFSHIFNGDMRLNIRLMGVLYGILMLAILGRTVVSPARGVTSVRRKNHGAVLAFGIGLMIVGYLGQFFGNMIKAAVSRQREFLADASAVQFTRNPDGIAGALKRIGGNTSGSVISHPESAELSHTFFAEGVRFSFARMMATHPPLEERIRRIDKGWEGEFLAPQATAESSAFQAGAMGFADSGVTPDSVTEKVGSPDEDHINQARELIDGLPAGLAAAAHDAYSVRALVYLMVLDDDQPVRAVQLSALQETADLGVFDELRRLLEQESLLEPRMRLPLLEMCFPALRQLSREQYNLFMRNLNTIVRADGRIGLSEWVIQKLIKKHLGEAFEGHRPKNKSSSLIARSGEAAVVLSLLAYASKQVGIEREAAFEAGRSELDLPVQMLGRDQLKFKDIDQALDTLAGLYPLEKPRLIKACVATVKADSQVTVAEADLLRMVSDLLDCPMPPLRVGSVS